MCGTSRGASCALVDVDIAGWTLVSSASCPIDPRGIARWRLDHRSGWSAPWYRLAERCHLLRIVDDEGELGVGIQDAVIPGPTSLDLLALVIPLPERRSLQRPPRGCALIHLLVHSLVERITSLRVLAEFLQQHRFICGSAIPDVLLDPLVRESCRGVFPVVHPQVHRAVINTRCRGVGWEVLPLEARPRLGPQGISSLAG
mmetsp:Transcript_4121/g.11954  ORF Transcript_4121/g.11954 Transcript_4121/m.11954 type:complete len:201 (-) Transcript_4121:444-1046(-)